MHFSVFKWVSEGENVTDFNSQPSLQGGPAFALLVRKSATSDFNGMTSPIMLPNTAYCPVQQPTLVAFSYYIQTLFPEAKALFLVDKMLCE